MLARADLDLNTRNVDGRSALHYSRQTFDLGLLLSRPDADILVADRLGHTPISGKCAFGYLGILYLSNVAPCSASQRVQCQGHRAVPAASTGELSCLKAASSVTDVLRSGKVLVHKVRCI